MLKFLKPGLLPIRLIRVAEFFEKRSFLPTGSDKVERDHDQKQIHHPHRGADGEKQSQKGERDADVNGMTANPVLKSERPLSSAPVFIP